MKTKMYFLALIFSCIGFMGIAQTRFLQKELDANEQVSFATLRTDSAPQPITQSVELLKSLYSMRNTDEVKPYSKKNEIRDASGIIHQYFEQYYRNVRVEHGTMSVHSDMQGNIETIFGYFKPVGDVEINPALSETEALQYALEHIGAEAYKWQIPEEEQWIKEYFNGTYYPIGELVIVKDRLKTDSLYRLAYRFDIYAHKPMSRDYVWVDAINGEIIEKMTRIFFANATGTAETRYSQTRTITTDSINGSYRLRESRNGVNISTFNMNHSWNFTDTDFTDNDNNWTTLEHQANNNNAGLDAHWGAEMTYDYFNQVHSRNSWDDNNGALLSYVNAYFGSGYRMNDNALWDVNKMVYGQGDLLPPFTTLDICAHEISHGICQSTANLLTYGESGAINESLSDIWGACVENWATNNKQRWLCGEDLGDTIRNMSSPGNHGQPNTYGGGPYWTGPNDDPHVNSGIMNYWFYLLTEGGSGVNGIQEVYNVVGIGIDKAAKIVYKAETETMFNSPSLNFANARNAMINAAKFLYFANSPEVIAVTNAWHAVGVGNQYPPLSISGPGSVCTSGVFSFVAPLGTTSIVWSGDSKLSITSGQGTSSATFSKTANGISTIKAVITADGNVSTLTKTVNVGVPDHPWVINGMTKDTFSIVLYPMCIGQGTTGLYLTLVDPDNSAPSNSYVVTKTLNPSNFTLLLNGNYLTVNPSNIGYGQFTVTANNGCGSSSVLTVNLTIPACVNGKIPIDPPGWPTDLVSIYPNPASNEITVDLRGDANSQRGDTEDQTYTITIIDLFGTTVYTGQKQGRQFNISTSSLSNGIYYVIISDGTNTVRKKLIIKH